ncbi:exocyst complex component Sec3-domain-containing protein [Aspergillus cavernicola]|uniref:Exocyst complex component Sec3-domain-containing protein n=1 Tax=Aspergillus cavernicola TaxID=176166 RepID=A0ABR4I0R4_9EURO
MSGRDRSRGPPGETPPQRDPRRGADSRNGGFAGPGDTTASRAEKFEDEKQRIIQSSFAKKDSDGSLVESYITHVRIIEDGAYPSSPAPPNASPENKKVRVIIVAVRRSGRVRMHKARENNDGTFSIGKTWMLDDLSAIQSFNAWVPSTPLEQQQKQWASNVGFIITVGKPYYWHAKTSKEKEFFLGSLVKIYKKYTGGKVPNLIGFDERERQVLLGTPPSAPPGTKGPVGPPHPEGSLPPPRPPSSQGSRPQSPHWGGTRSRDGPKRRPTDEELPIRVQKSREQMSRPSTGQSGKSGPPPFGPPPHPPPVAPIDQGDQPPPRAIERLAADTRTPKSSPLSPPESRNKEIPSSLRTPSATSREKTSKDSEDGSLSSFYTEPRPPSSRSGKALAEPRPILRGQDSSSGISEARRAKEDMVPGLAPSDLRVKEPLKGGSAMLSTSPGQPIPPVRDQLSSANMHPADVPPGLRPGSSASNNAAAKAIEAPQPVSEKKAEPSEPITESKPLSPPTSPPEDPKEAMEDDADAHRPGLGPMIKKKSNKDVAGIFRKAATTYGAFKPRPGGAGEKLLAAAKKQAASDEPDGITGVVPAPFLRKGNESDNMASPEDTTTEEPTASSWAEEALQTPPNDVPAAPEPPKVEITEPVADVTIAASSSNPSVDVPGAMTAGTDERSRSVSPSPRDRRRRRHEDNTIKYCQALGLDPKVLAGRGVDFDDILTDLGWNGRISDEKRIEDLEGDVRREIGRVEATSWLGNLEQQEGKVDQLAKLIDKTVEECEELDNLLTLYSHELNTLRDDVSYIETQSQGLQVQTANQKLLQTELQNLLKTLSISAKSLQPLKEASLSNPDGLRETEVTLSTLYKAMLMIDPDIWHNKKRLDAAGDHGSAGVYADTEIGQMRAIKDKKEEYRFHCSSFLQRLKQFMAIAYKVAEQKRIDAPTIDPKNPTKLDGQARAYSRRELWVYNALTLFAREVSGTEWQGLIALYEQQGKQSYQAEFRDNNMVWKKAARKPSGEEQELLFTHQDKEKEAEGITTAARKLTVRRGKTIKAAAGFRLSFGEKQHGKVESYEVFSGTLRETIGMIVEEQNFAVRFFHLTSLSSMDFADLVASGNPEERPLPDFTAKQSPDPDRGMARKVEQVMDELFSFWPTDMQNLVDWSIKADPLQGIGILFALEKSISELDETNQDFIIHSLQKIHSRLIGLFNRFVDEQIRGIEETKVKVNKRKGVISFMRVFPNFSAAVENMLSDPSHEFYDVRISVNEAYDRINRAMWESLKFIAKEAPGHSSVAATSGSGDPEDKEILNYHILLIENMNHYIEEVEVRNLPVLERWRDRAQQDLEEHMKLYLDSVIHRPLGKLVEFVESAESLLVTTTNPADIASRPSHSRSVAKKVLATYDGKEIRRGIEMLKKRVEKHFGDADDPGLSRSLVLKVLRECEGRYEKAYDQTRRVLHAVYEGQLEPDWRKEDAVAMFRK